MHSDQVTGGRSECPGTDEDERMAGAPVEKWLSAWRSLDDDEGEQGDAWSRSQCHGSDANNVAGRQASLHTGNDRYLAIPIDTFEL